MNAASAWGNRHPSVAHFRQLFEFDHLPEGMIRDTSHLAAQLAEDMLMRLGDGPELSAGLRKLLEAKDCLVRQAVIDERWRQAQHARDATGAFPVIAAPTDLIRSAGGES